MTNNKILDIFLIGLLGFCTCLPINAQLKISPNKPALVVHIVIDQMRADYISRFWDNFSEGGFKKVVQGGTFFNHTIYPYQFTQEIADYASLSTGTTPSRHGINSYFTYNRKAHELQSPLADDNSLTIGMETGINGFSPKHLLSTTVGDELKKSSFGQSKVASVSLNKEAAILLAGHSADGAFWLDEKTGQWVTSNYYANWIPQWTQQINQEHRAIDYMEEKWDLLHTKSQYVNQPPLAKSKPYDRFPFDFSVYKYNKANYRILKSTPYGNKMVTDLVIKLVDEEKYGTDEYPDLLYVNFGNVNSLKMVSDPYSLRTEDMIMRIDFELEKLIEHLEKKIGKEKVMFVISSTQAAADMPQALKEYNLPNGTLQPQKVTALLNSYLMAMYGQGKWITYYNNNQIYMNHELIKRSSHSKEEVFNEAALFLEEFTGIAYAHTSFALKNATGGKTGQLKNVENIFYPGQSGDIFITLEPGWIEVMNDEFHPGIPCNSNIRVPMIFYGWKVAREKINAKASPLDIAPTLSDVFGITLPNESSGELLKITKYTN